MMLATAVALPLIMGMASLAVDLGRVQTAKSELRAATDAAARYAASVMRTTSATGVSAASVSAAAVMAENKVDGSVAPFNGTTDLTLGIWNASTKTFTAAALGAGANAVRLQTKLTMGDSARPLLFASVLGRAVTIRATSIVMMNGRTASTYVSGKGNPWLAGMPAGTVSDNYRTDSIGLQDAAGSGPNMDGSPGMIDLASAQISAGGSIKFDTVTGTASNGSGSSTVTADGNSGQIVSLGTNGTSTVYQSRPMNGISNARAPINAMVAVFLNDNAPNTTAAPAALDFMSAAQRDYASISPLVKQVFFIGDGRRSNGEVQQIVVPAGATRLFIGNMDAWQWNDNTGGYTATANSTISVTTVR